VALPRWSGEQEKRAPFPVGLSVEAGASGEGVKPMGIVTWACLVVVGWLRWPSWTPMATFVVVATMDAALYSTRGGGVTDWPMADLAFRYALMLSAYLAAYWAGRALERAVRSRSSTTD